MVYTNTIQAMLAQSLAIALSFRANSRFEQGAGSWDKINAIDPPGDKV